MRGVVVFLIATIGAAGQPPERSTFTFAWLQKVTKTESGYRYDVDTFGEVYVGESDTPLKVTERTNIRYKIDGKARILYVMDEDGAIRETRYVQQRWTGTSRLPMIDIREDRIVFVDGNGRSHDTRCKVEDRHWPEPSEFFLDGREVWVRDATRRRFPTGCTLQDLQAAVPDQ